MKRVLVPLADGFEEIEAITIIDLLRRAGIEVVTAGLAGRTVHAAHQVIVQADATLDQAAGKDYDMVVLPGGMPGAEHLNSDPRVHEVLKRTAERGAPVAAICAAPIVLEKAGLLKGRKATSYPGFLDKMDLPDVEYTGASVESDGPIITSKGPGTAMDFALAIIERLLGRAERDKVEKGLMRP